MAYIMRMRIAVSNQFKSCPYYLLKAHGAPGRNKAFDTIIPDKSLSYVVHTDSRSIKNEYQVDSNTCILWTYYS